MSAPPSKRRRTAAPPPISDSAARVDRARGRAATQPPPVMGRQDTPFGPVTLTDRGRGKGGLATTGGSDFPGSGAASKTDGSYAQLLGAADPRTLKAVEQASRRETHRAGTLPPAPAPVLNPDQRRIAAHLFGVGRSERQRNPAAGKGFRAGLRAAIVSADAGEDGSSRAIAARRAFPQAGVARDAPAVGFALGARALRPPERGGEPGLRGAKARDQAGDSFSDSSDDEAPTRRKRKR